MCRLLSMRGWLFFFLFALLFAGASPKAVAGACANTYQSLHWAGHRFPVPAQVSCGGYGGEVTLCTSSMTRINFKSPWLTEDKSWGRFLRSDSCMCVSSSTVPSDFKRRYCQSSPYHDADGVKLVTWSDGEHCKCKARGSNEERDCSLSNPFANYSRPKAPVARNVAPPPEPKRTRAPENRVASNRNNNPRPPPRDNSERDARLAADRAERADAARAQAAEAAKEAEEQAAAAAAAQAEQQAVATARACVDREVGEVSEGCRSSASEASNSCKGTDAKATASANVIGAAAGNLIKSHSAGAQQECFNSGVFSYGAAEGIGTVRDSCATDVEHCTETCGLDKAESETTIRTVCEAEIGGREDVLAYLHEKVSGVGAEVEASKVVCEQAATDLRELNTMVDNMGDATHKSAICACKLSTGGAGKSAQSGGCNAIPSVKACSENPENQACVAYATMAICAPNSSNYDENACNCQRNPQGPGCSSNQLSAALTSAGSISGSAISSFATGGTQPSNMAINAISGGTSGTNSQTDLSQKASDKPEGSPIIFGSDGGSKVDSTKTSSGGSSGGSASATAAEPRTSDETKPIEEDAKGIKGIFGMAKSYISKAFFKSDNGNGDITKAKKENVDFNRFKPRRLRGIASEDETGNIGRSNMDIWIMMNKCSGGESCKSNLNNYITTP